MDLDEWNALSPERREERKRRWIPRVEPGRQAAPEEVEWLSLVAEAQRRFAAEFGHLPEILYIGSSCWFSDRDPVVVHVRTNLPEGQSLREIPDAYLTFPVEQEPVADEIASFKATWRAVLSRLFDWPDRACDDWIEGMGWLYRNPFFLHDPPSDYLPRVALARSVVGPRGEIELRKIGDELVRAIGGSFYVEQEPDFDWSKARDRISRVILEHGGVGSSTDL